MPPIVRLQKSRGEKDCAITALAMYLDHSYEDVLAAAAHITHARRPHHRGMFTREIRAIAKRLGHTLRLRRAFDIDSDEGIVGFISDTEPDDHVALVKNGLVFADGTVWEHELFCAHFGYRPVSLLERSLA
jgi:hypothetical protein